MIIIIVYNIIEYTVYNIPRPLSGKYNLFVNSLHLDIDISRIPSFDKTNR